MRTTNFLGLVAVVGLGCAHGGFGSSATTAVDANAIAAAQDRTEADRALDPGRKPVPFVRFLKLRPGMRVGELFSGTGYSTELIARAVGPTGVVYGQNTPSILKMFAEKGWSERLARPVNKNVVRVDRDLDNPLPPDASNLDLVVTNLNYHDFVWMNVNRTKLNRIVFSALKPGGHYVICDSTAKAGTGLADVKTLHRIDESVVRQEVPSAGFVMVAEGTFLRNPADTRDWNASPMAAGEKRGTSDRFCFDFQRP